MSRPDPPRPTTTAVVELRLIGAPGDVDHALAAFATAIEVHPGRRKPTRDRDSRVIQYATLIVAGDRDA